MKARTHSSKWRCLHVRLIHKYKIQPRIPSSSSNSAAAAAADAADETAEETAATARSSLEFTHFLMLFDAATSLPSSTKRLYKVRTQQSNLETVPPTTWFEQKEAQKVEKKKSKKNRKIEKIEQQNRCNI